MNNLDITFLATKQILNGSNQLKIFKKIGTQAAITDFSILLGGYFSEDHYINNEKKLENRTGWYWTCTDDKDHDARIINSAGKDGRKQINNRHGGARLALLFTQIKSIYSNKLRRNDGILEIEYGEYPQQVAPQDLQLKLERLYSSRVLELCETKNSYTIDSIKYDEYKYRGKKYVRVTANIANIYDDKIITLSNGVYYRNNDVVWVEVQPIKWLIDEEKNIAITEKIIFAGIPFNNERNYEGLYRTTDIKKFIDNIFSVDIIPPKVEVKPVNTPNFNLQSETRKPKIVNANIEYKEGTNITLTLPNEILKNIDSITIESEEDKQNQVVYVKKRPNNL